MRWPLRRTNDRPPPGRLPSLGQDFAEGHRRYVANMGHGAELWLRTKPFSAPPGHELGECLRTFAHIVQSLDLGLRAQILDVGCGPGWLSEFLVRCGYRVTGVDISEDMVAIARDRVAGIDRIGIDLDPVAEFHAMPVTELPWEDRFDAVILYDAMHHFDDEIGTLKVIRRALAPGGRIFIHEGIRPEPGSAGEQFLIAEMEEFGTLESPFDPDYLVTVLAEAGFTGVTRFAAVDRLFEVAEEKRELEWLQGRLRYPPMNTVLALNPISTDTAPGPDSFRARIEAVGSWEPTKDGQDLALNIQVVNVGTDVWPAGHGDPLPHGAVTVAPFLANDEGRTELHRVLLPRALAPGESIGAEIRVPRSSVAEADEFGVDLAREGVDWFVNYGSTPLMVPLPDRA